MPSNRATASSLVISVRVKGWAAATIFCISASMASRSSMEKGRS